MSVTLLLGDRTDRAMTVRLAVIRVVCQINPLNHLHLPLFMMFNYKQLISNLVQMVIISKDTMLVPISNKSSKRKH